MRVCRQLVRHPLTHANPRFLQRDHLFQIVGHQADFPHAQQLKHPRCNGEIARFVGQAKPTIRVDRVETLVLQLVSPQLVDQADPAPFLPQVEQGPPAALRGLIRHGVKRGIELWPTIAFEAAEDIACETFAVQADQRGAIRALPTDDQGNVFAHVVNAAKGHNLGIFRCCHGQVGTGCNRQGCHVTPDDEIGRRYGDTFACIDGIDKESGKDSGQTRKLHRRFCLFLPFQRVCKERPLEG